MKAAFAKMVDKNVIESSHVAFRAGGSGVPILTRASASSTTGFQTNGLPGANINKTVLGSYRMGDQDGEVPASAIYAPGDIFSPPGQPKRSYPVRTFEAVGNNVYQPEGSDLATHALLLRLGDQQFKAKAAQPFEDYMAQQRLAKDLEAASRNASLSDLGIAREIIRNVAAQRRQQNEDDYLRKMLDAGATPEAARKEIEDVRNANAIQEAKKVDDREYQAKMMIQKIAMARGITPMVQEPLNQSSSIDNPQRSQAMSQAMGKPGEGFGTSPLDANRKTPDFYKKFLRRSTTSQEAQDEAQAFSQMLTEGEIPAPSHGAFSLATLKGHERQLQIENAQDTLGARLDTLRARGQRLMKPLPANIIMKQILDKLYSEKNKHKGNKVLYSYETIEDLKPTQLLIAMNLATITNSRGLVALKEAIDAHGPYGSATEPAEDLTSRLKAIVLQVNGGEPNISIPYASAIVATPSKLIVQHLIDIKTTKSDTLSKQIKSARDDYIKEVNSDELPFSKESDIKIPKRTGNGTRKNTGKPLIEILQPSETEAQPKFSKPNSKGTAFSKQGVRKGASISEKAENALKSIAVTKIQALVRGRKARKPKVVPPQPPADTYDQMTLAELKSALKAAGKPVTVKNKDEAIARLRAQ
jgi:hypothetical protein